MGTDSFLVAADSFFGLALASAAGSGGSGAAEAFLQFRHDTKVVIAYARAGISTTMRMSGSQALKPPDDGAAAVAASGASAASSAGAASVRLAGAGIVD